MVRTSLYLSMMGAAAAASLVRGFAVAAALPPEEFTLYAVAVATGALLANFLSFGLIESTVKQFPRLVLAGGAGHLLEMSDAGARRLAIRAAVLVPVVGAGMYFLAPTEPLLFLAVVAGAFCAAWLNLLASVQRAMLDVLNVALANGARSLLYLILAAAGATFFGLVGALAGEIVGALLGVFASRLIFKATLRKNSHPQPQALANPSIQPESGITLFIAYSALAMPLYLDRAFVMSVVGLNAAATYSVLALFSGGATVLVNIVAQKIGPEIIARERTGMTLSGLIAIATRWSAAVAAVWVVSIATVGWAFSVGWLSFLEKYHLTPQMFTAVLMLGCLQVTSIFEFILLARDQEFTFLKLALGYLAIICTIAGFAALHHPTLIDIIYLFSFAKLAYLAAMLVTLRLQAATKGTR